MTRTATMVAAPSTKATPKRRKKTTDPTYTVIVTREKDGRYVVCAPALDYCGGYGDTLPEALQHAEEAIALWLDGQRRHGWPIPADNPKVTIDTTDVTDASVQRLTIRKDILACLDCRG